MLNQLLKSMQYNQELSMLYMDKSVQVSKRSIQAIQVGEEFTTD
ncbi:hypothetical protein ACFPRA_19465 [Sporosarcina soli]|uniref:Uncharacterized protein n=1 Tax=Sporosarcina soli TaxID=334736 RepID=A0ABW0TNH0_9BACL